MAERSKASKRAARWRGSKTLEKVEVHFDELPHEHKTPHVLKALARVAGVPDEVVMERYRLALALWKHGVHSHELPNGGKVE